MLGSGTARRTSEGRRDEGSVTVEFAAGLPSVVLVMALALSAVAWMLDVQVAQRAATEAARVAIVDSDARALEVGSAVAAGGHVTLSRDSSYVTACVRGHREPWPAFERCATAWSVP